MVLGYFVAKCSWILSLNPSLNDPENQIEVDQRTKRDTRFMTEPGVLIGEWKKFAIMKELGDDLPDIGIGDRKSDHDFMSVCKVDASC
ncbi:hypothetical protein E3N88_33509 [Mikania micrantha]|uniref:Uncharacterized protein n=1 Tax=Mikania micrantha TaxID=192012 RepID=A0A5N6ME21_9ASTR|nr:hypothetical protein E3N88_33509 [Mikania micrantha]